MPMPRQADPSARGGWSARWLSIALVLLLIAAACSADDQAPEGGGATPAPTPDTPGGTATEGATGAVRLEVNSVSDGRPEDDEGLTVVLSEGGSQQQPTDDRPTVGGEPLDDDTTSNLIARLPELVEDDEDRQDFNRPAESLPPPLIGDTVDVPFPADGTLAPPDVPSGPLEVLRFQPEGDITVAPFVSVTFNQPMVPLGTLEQLDAAAIPATITPELPGRWIWIGTRTLRFEHDPEIVDRFPMATTYRVEVPAGTTSETGGELPETVSWEFATPPLTVEQVVPGDEPIDLDPVWFMRFDQAIDPVAVLATIRLEADGQDQGIHLATDTEIAADQRVERHIEQAIENRWLAFALDAPLPKDSPVVLTMGPGTPSAEGPRLTTEAFTSSSRTFGPLRIVNRECGYGGGCRPFAPFDIEFNNPLDGETFDPASVSIRPEIPGAVVGVSGRHITIRGATSGQTDYEVTISGEVGDVFGQQLGDDQTVRFQVGSASPVLAPFDRHLITVDPIAETPTIPVATINHDELRVRAYAVGTDDWPDYLRYLDQPDDVRRVPSQWREVADETIDVDGEEDALTETGIDVLGLLGAEQGHLVLVVEPTGRLADLDFEDDEYWANRPTSTWVQVTQIGVDAILDNDEMVVWTTDLGTGEPLPRVGVELVGGSTTITTDGDGIARTDLNGRVRYLVATDGADTALLSAFRSPEAGWERYGVTDELRWYVFDDRKIYRPEETVSLKGWVRRVTLASTGRLEVLTGDPEVAYTIFDPQGNEIGAGRTEVSALGGFDLTFDLPAESNLGQARVDLSLSGGAGLGGTSTSHWFDVQQFRTPEFETSARNETTAPYFPDSSAVVAVQAEYFAGGPLPDAEVAWTVTTAPGSYSPPGWDDFTFGDWTPWWYFEDYFYDGGFGADASFDAEFCCDPYFEQGRVESFEGTTDATGTHFLQIDFRPGDEPEPTTVTASGTVFDVNRQGWASSTSLLVHPADLYVGLRSTRTFVRQGEPLDIEAIVTDLDGNATPGTAVTVAASRLEWSFEGGRWDQRPVETQTCDVPSAAEAVSCRFDTEIGGEYEVVATVVDGQGRNNRSTLTRWVSGGSRRPTRGVELEEATLVPDRQDYEPGDTAEILVESPFFPAHGLLTIARNGIETTETFRVDEGSVIVEVPIADDDIPNLDVQIDLVGSAERTADDGTPLPELPRRPAFATGRLRLSIPPLSRTLAVEAAPADDELEPGATTTVDVSVADATGTAVEGAEVAVVVVDEAILALTNYQLADPIGVFYRELSAQLQAEYGRSAIVLTDPAALLAALGGDGDLAGDGGEDFAEEEPAAQAESESLGALADEGGRAIGQDQQAIDLRTDFDALATFAPEVITDGQGRATVDVELPDNLTRYRVMAVAVSGDDRFGSAESNITARLPLMVRPSAPRFLNFGDAFELPVVVQNQTDSPLDVDLVIDTTNLELTDGAGRRVTVPADDRIEVRFPARADEAGTARFQVAGVSGDFSDAAAVALPVYTPATSEAFATYGVVDDGAVVQPVLAPEGVFPQFGGLELNTSSTALQALTDAVLYVHEYPYRSSDALASRILTIAALRDVLEAFEVDGLPTPAEIEARVANDVEALAGLQNFDGGFPYWQRGRQSIPYHSIQATHALVRARQAGYEVPEQLFQRALDYVRFIEDFYPSDYSQSLRDTLSSYALHVRKEAGEADVAKATELYNRAGDDLSLEALAWLWPTLEGSVATDEIERRFANSTTETAGAATFVTDYGEDGYLILHSNRRTDAIILDALVDQTPDSDLVPKVVAGLMAGRTKGRWGNIQENTFVLLALRRYFDTFEAVDPDFVARLWLGDLYAAEHVYEGRSTDRNQSTVAMDELIELGDTDLVVSKDGTGRLYYRLGLRYAPDDLELDPLDQGFVVQRTYEAVDDPDDVRLDDDGVWHVKAGASVRVRLTMVADSRRTHVALVDPLPAGLEIVNPSLAVSPDVDAAPESRGIWWWWQWYIHQNLRDDRAEAFTDYLWAGTFEYSYVARATTPGRFVTPPAKAEEMYSPEVFGRSASAVLVVEA